VVGPYRLYWCSKPSFKMNISVRRIWTPCRYRLPSKVVEIWQEASSFDIRAAADV
jgi:hypothetical protein